MRKKKYNNGNAYFTIHVPDSLKDSKVYKSHSFHHLIYSICGLVLGYICIIGGIFLFLNDVIGSSDWTASFFGLNSELTDAAPGTILFIVGLFIVAITRYSTKSHKL